MDTPDPWVARGRERAERSWIRGPTLGWDEFGLPDVVDPREDPGGYRLCLAPRPDGQRCDRLAGSTTSHFGVGRCRRCGGNTREGRAEASWMTINSIARELDVTPWDALQTVVRRSAGMEEFLYRKLQTTVEYSEQLIQVDSEPARWLRMWVAAMERTAKFSKMAVDAGVAERMAAVQEVTAATVVRVFNEALAASQLPPELEAGLRTALAGSLRALEAGPSGG